MKQILFVVLLLCFAGNTQAQNKFRWDVKTLTDGFQSDLLGQVFTSVEQIQKFSFVRVTDTTPRLDMEQAVVMVVGTVVKKTLNPDGELLIELKSATTDSTITCESVFPDDPTAKKSIYQPLFQRARTKLKTIKIGSVITVTGILYQDKPDQKPSMMQIRNCIGICPVLKIDLGRQDPMVNPKIRKL